MSRRGDFFEDLCNLCEIHGGSMTSGYRTEKRNKEVGGHSDSQHRYGLAFDIVLDDNSEEARDKFKRDCWRFGLVVVDSYKHHIHVQALTKLEK